jgi:hypothetical protein
MKTILALLGFAFSVNAADTAIELAAKLSALQQDGSSFVRLKMQTKGITLQLQIKQRRTAKSTEVLYQVLWPKERLGESVLLKKIGNQAATGSVFVPPESLRKINLNEALFGSDLFCTDVLENFFAWPNQTFVGIEVVNRISCQILESKPGKNDTSNYTIVRTWVDVQRLVPLRIEKHNAVGKVILRIDSGRVVTDDISRYVPSGLTVTDLRSNSVTELEGSKMKHAVTFTDDDFKLTGLK